MPFLVVLGIPNGQCSLFFSAALVFLSVTNIQTRKERKGSKDQQEVSSLGDCKNGGTITNEGIKRELF